MLLATAAVLLAASPPQDFAERACTLTALQPHLLPRPHGGTHEWTFALCALPRWHPLTDCVCQPPHTHRRTGALCGSRYGVPALNDGQPVNGSAFANATAAMQKFGVGNGFDPFGTSIASFTEGSRLGWPISFSPIEGGNVCFQVPGCVNNMTVEQHSRLKILDKANVYYEIQYDEF